MANAWHRLILVFCRAPCIDHADYNERHMPNLLSSLDMYYWQPKKIPASIDYAKGSICTKWYHANLEVDAIDSRDSQSELSQIAKRSSRQICSNSPPKSENWQKDSVAKIGKTITTPEGVVWVISRSRFFMPNWTFSLYSLRSIKLRQRPIGSVY
jgi:hypothetical protein